MARAPSVSLYYTDNFPGDIIHQSVMVPKNGDTMNTYYCCLQWNAGKDGGGYCGIQDNPQGKIVIYSIWNPNNYSQKVRPYLTGTDSKSTTFGGEGEGMKVLNYNTTWSTDKWFSLATRTWDAASHTYFGFWFKDESANEWHHIVTADFPKPGIKFQGRTSCFVEDWLGTGEHNRNARFRNGFKRKLDGTWFPFSSARFNVNQEAATSNHNQNYDAGTISDAFYLSTGGTVLPTDSIGTQHSFEVAATSMPHPPIDFTISSADVKQVNRTIPASSTPQYKYKYKYTILVKDQSIASKTETEVRSPKPTQGTKWKSSWKTSLEIQARRPRLLISRATE